MASDEPTDRAVLRGRASPRAAWAAACSALVVFGAAATTLLVRQQPPAAMIGGIVFALAAAVVPAYVLIDARRRAYEVTATMLSCRGGVFGHYEIDVALQHVGGVSIRQGWIQRLLGCGDVVVFAPGVGAASGIVATAADMHSIRLRSIPDFRAVGQLLRAKVQTASPRA